MYTTSKYKKNADLNSPQVKNQILKYLYTKINVDKVPQEILNISDINNIKKNDYIICPRCIGTRSWIIFCKINDVYYAVNFPKHSQKKKLDLVIHATDLRVKAELYNGTIMEGVFFKMDDNKFLIIEEVYYLAGHTELLKPKDDRLANLANYINTSITRTETYHVYVSQFYQINKKSLTNLYDKIKSDTKIQGITFYPKNFVDKIYNYTIIDDDLIDNIVKYAYFRMCKTKNPDVYTLLSIKTKNKIGIALVPDMESSKKFVRWYKVTKSNELIVKCQLETQKNKWIPIEYENTDTCDSNLESNSN